MSGAQLAPKGRVVQESDGLECGAFDRADQEAGSLVQDLKGYSADGARDDRAPLPERLAHRERETFP